MDTGIESDRATIERILAEYAKDPYAYGEIERQLVFDRDRDHYLLLSVGWDKSRVHGCVIHIDLIDGKCWIQRDGTETGVARSGRRRHPQGPHRAGLQAAGDPTDHRLRRRLMRPSPTWAYCEVQPPGRKALCR
jgi:XisI protein